jgi:hypothetical protein
MQGVPKRRIAGLYKRGTTQQRASHGQAEWTIYYSRVPKPGRAVWFWFSLGPVALLLAFFLYSPIFKNFVDEAADWAKNIMGAHPIIGALVFFLFSAVSAMLAFASSVVLVPPANLVWGKLVTFLLLWGGWMAGAIAAFGIGKLVRPLVIQLGYRE